MNAWRRLRLAFWRRNRWLGYLGVDVEMHEVWLWDKDELLRRWGRSEPVVVARTPPSHLVARTITSNSTKSTVTVRSIEP